MAFKVRNLSVLAYAQGFTLWHYKSPTDAIGAVEQPGFFDSAGDMLAAGDMLLVSAPNAGKLLFVPQISRPLRTTALAA